MAPFTSSSRPDRATSRTATRAGSRPSRTDRPAGPGRSRSEGTRGARLPLDDPWRGGARW